MSTFVIDYPYLDMDKNRRLGYRLRIRSILPEYMKGTDFFNAFYDTIDEVFEMVKAKEEDLMVLIYEIIKHLDDDFDCPCQHALNGAEV